MDQKKNFSSFSYKLVQIFPIMILVNSGAFLSISSWFCELTKLIFVMILYILLLVTPQSAKDYGYVQVANHRVLDLTSHPALDPFPVKLGREPKWRHFDVL